MTDPRFDIVVVGGGIVGLATALQITRGFPGQRLLLVEKEDRVGQHQSGHNSGVVHSGIYYTPGSLKARLCLEGARAMVEFCAEQGIAHRIVGKVIVATREEELPRLQALLERGRANGLEGLRLLEPAQIRELEPHCAGIAGLHVPSTGLADYPAVCEAFARLVTAHGGVVRTATKVRGLAHGDREMVVETNRGTFATRYVINCAGLHSDRVSRLAGRAPEIRIVPFRGEYYDLVPEKEYLVRALIYPVPDPRFPFLGVHFTQRVHGGVDAGPNAVLALAREGYRRTDFNVKDVADIVGYPGFWRMAGRYWRSGAEEIFRASSKKGFVKALRRLVPEIAGADLVADGSGVRAQAVRGDGSLVDDFQFERAGSVLNVCNVPSPAATASLSIGREIARMAADSFALPRN